MPSGTGTIHVVRGTGTATTRKASFDAALADAGVHQYNLRTLSSVIPAGATISIDGTAPALGPTGNALDVVLARQTSAPGARAAAGLAWVRDDDGTGVFYEAGDHDPETVAEVLRMGLEAGCELRAIEVSDPETEIVTADPSPDRYATAVVLATYGDSKPLL
jgi:arginine decarboxylase